MVANRSDREARGARGDLRRVLVVDDEEDIRELLDLTLSRMGLAADCAATVSEARSLISSGHYDLCLTDMKLPDGEGLEVVRAIGEMSPQTPVAVITAYGSAENAVAALKAGAFDYLAKPVALDQLRALVKAALALPEVSGDGAQLMIGNSQVINAVKETIARIARSQAPVYISGESGSGKELAARFIHSSSSRAAGAFVPVNCGAIPEALMESEFFGHRKGAFTGADADREGFFQAADGGTLFLDEVADLPLPMQVKLLRAIQEKRVRPVGSVVEVPVDVRIISATHRNLRECVDQGVFRQDLYYRLDVIQLRMPALRERAEDIPLLVSALLKRIGAREETRLTDAAMAALMTYPFPGNVRELENILERATALSSSMLIDAEDLLLSPHDLPGGIETQSGYSEISLNESLDETLNRVERQAILDALEKTAGNRTAAAHLLGVTFRSLRYRIERLGIDGDGGC